MANARTEQIIIDGDRNVVVKCTGVLDTSNLAVVDIVLPSGLAPIPTLLRIDHIDYSISDQLEVQLFWKATADVLILPLAGRGRLSFWNFGGLQNNAGAGVDGTIRLSTTGWASGVQTYSIVLELVKQGV
jgi:hypothetical protein